MMMPPQVDPAIANPTVAEGKAALERGDLTLAELRAMQALQMVPDHLDALILLYQCRKRANQIGPKLEGVLRAIVRKNPNLFWATSELAFMLFGRGERVECEVHARNAIRLAPRDPQAHGIMGLMLAMMFAMGFYLIPQINHLQAQVAVPMSALELADPRRVEFDKLHGYSNIVFSITAIGGLALCWWEARE